jgi:hypothetical protein
MRTMNRLAAIPALKARAMVGAAAITAMILFGAASANGQGLPPVAKELNPAQTALVLVDFQYPFTSPDGANYRNVKKEMDEKRLLDGTLELVRKARSLGVLVVHITEGYSSDYRELDPTNPGGFHRGQILRQAWKIGTRSSLTMSRSMSRSSPLQGTKISSYRRASKLPRLEAPD